MGTAVALPFLDAMVPAFAAPRAGKPPVRMAFVYVPNGIDHERTGIPDYEGKLGELPRILKPLEPFKDDILLLGNLTHNTGRALLDGAGDHGRCCGCYLTGIQVKKSTGRYQGRRLHGSDRRQPDRRRRRASRRSNSAWKMRARRAIAIPATPARTPTIWRGAARRSRCRRSSIRARCSNACSATAWR